MFFAAVPVRLLYATGFRLLCRIFLLYDGCALYRELKRLNLFPLRWDDENAFLLNDWVRIKGLTRVSLSYWILLVLSKVISVVINGKKRCIVVFRQQIKFIS